MAEPTNIALGSNGRNARLKTNGHGQRLVKCIGLNYGLGIIAKGDGDESRSRKAFYPVVTTSSSFGIVIGFSSWQEREDFNTWMTGYMEAVSTSSGLNGWMEVAVPARNFLKTAVPEGDLDFGEGVGDTAYQITLNFVGASDPLDNEGLTNKKAGISYFKPPGDKTGQGLYLSPAGRQLKGAESLEGTMFDDTYSSPGFQQAPNALEAIYSAGLANGSIAPGTSFADWRKNQ